MLGRDVEATPAREGEEKMSKRKVLVGYLNKIYYDNFKFGRLGNPHYSLTLCENDEKDVPLMKVRITIEQLPQGKRK